MILKWPEQIEVRRCVQTNAHRYHSLWPNRHIRRIFHDTLPLILIKFLLRSEESWQSRIPRIASTRILEKRSQCPRRQCEWCICAFCSVTIVRAKLCSTHPLYDAILFWFLCINSSVDAFYHFVLEVECISSDPPNFWMFRNISSPCHLFKLFPSLSASSLHLIQSQTLVGYVVGCYFDPFVIQLSLVISYQMMLGLGFSCVSANRCDVIGIFASMGV